MSRENAGDDLCCGFTRTFAAPTAGKMRHELKDEPASLPIPSTTRSSDPANEGDCIKHDRGLRPKR